MSLIKLINTVKRGFSKICYLRGFTIALRFFTLLGVCLVIFFFCWALDWLTYINFLIKSAIELGLRCIDLIWPLFTALYSIGLKIRFCIYCSCILSYISFRYYGLFYFILKFNYLFLLELGFKSKTLLIKISIWVTKLHIYTFFPLYLHNISLCLFFISLFCLVNLWFRILSAPIKSKYFKKKKKIKAPPTHSNNPIISKWRYKWMALKKKVPYLFESFIWVDDLGIIILVICFVYYIIIGLSHRYI